MVDMPKTGHERPLSPHLSIWRPKITFMMSIIHRITGGALYFGTLILAWWLIAAAAGPDYFAFVNDLLGSIVGQIVLVGYTWTLLHHMAGGIRHLVWDTGHGIDIPQADYWAWGTLIASVTLTLVLWVVAYALV